MKSPDAEDYVLGIAGAGAMGQGIAQVAVEGGIRTLILDARPGAAEAAKAAIEGRLARLVEKGRMGAEAADAAGRLLEPVAGAADLAPCDAVVEAIVEDADVKRTLFREVEGAVRPDCLIASNTSSIPIASLARACERRDRVAGLHFFNPVPLMKLVEVIRAAETSDATVGALTLLGRRLGRVHVTVKDSPGFLVNMGGRAFTTEALAILQERVATPSQVDAILRDCWGFRMGPFELMDLTGMDVNYPVSRIVWEGYQNDPRLRTAPPHRALAEAGLLGRKTGAGWYRYADGRAVDVPSPDHETSVAPAGRVTLLRQGSPYAGEAAFAPGGGGAAEAPEDRLAALCDEAGLKAGEDDGACPILAAPVGPDATAVAVATGADHRRLVCLDLEGDTTRRITLMTPPGADPAHRDAVASALAATGRKVTAIKDSPGFVGQRVAAMIANLGCHMAEVGLASPADIDTAMKLGLNYPAGPLELADRIGVARTHGILAALQQATGDDRYRPTQWLRRRALLGLAAATPS